MEVSFDWIWIGDYFFFWGQAGLALGKGGMRMKAQRERGGEEGGYEKP